VPIVHPFRERTAVAVGKTTLAFEVLGQKGGETPHMKHNKLCFGEDRLSDQWVEVKERGREEELLYATS